MLFYAANSPIRAQRILREYRAWMLFLLLSAGLGYPTLNRYNPRTQLPDAAAYANLALSGPGAADIPALPFGFP